MGAKEEAVALKDEGNKAIANKEWGKAVGLYTKAIELDGTQCVFYGNRAQVGLLLVLTSAVPHISYPPQYPRASHPIAICIALSELLGS